MAIGSNTSKNTANTQSTGLKTGTKVGVNTSTPNSGDTTAGIFQGLNEYRLHKDEIKAEVQKQKISGEDAWQHYKDNAPGSKQEVLNALAPTIDAAVTNMVGGDRRYLTRARLMALEALPGYDPRQGVSLNTYVYNRLQGLKRLSADRGNFIHVPERSALERKQLEAIKQDYILETGAEPSLAMLADKSGMPLNKVGRLMSIFGTTSTSATRGEHGDSLEAKGRNANELYIDSFYTELPEIDKKIYEWSTGYKGSPRLDRATMAKRLGISEAAVSQHASKIDRLAARFNQTLTGSIYGER